MPPRRPGTTLALRRFENLAGVERGPAVNRSSYLNDTLVALAGVGFAVLLLFAFATVDPLSGATDQEITAWWADPENQRDSALSMYFMIGAAGCFLVFLAGVRGRLASAEGGPAPFTGLVFAAGISFAAVLLVTDISRGAIAHSVRFGDETLPDAGTLRAFTTFSQVGLGLVGMPRAALMVGSASWLILRTKAFGAWLGWAGVVVAVVILGFSVALIGPWASPLLQLWVVAASVELWRTRHREAAVQRREGLELSSAG